MADTYEAAENLKMTLEASFEKVEVFKDTYNLNPGDDLPSHIAKAIRRADVVLILIDRNWLLHPHPSDPHLNRLEYERDWVRMELELVHDYKKDFIPVIYGNESLLSPEACRRRLPEKLQFLSSNTLAHYIRKESPALDRENLLKKLEEKYKLQRKVNVPNLKNSFFSPENPILSILNETFPLPKYQIKDLPRSPFVGLKSFGEKEAPIFFGRSREIFDLCYRIARTTNCRLLLLEGYSGTGKSSLLQAGIIPRMRNQGWSPGYARREENTTIGLSAVLDLATQRSSVQTGIPLLIIDQVEEAFTHKNAQNSELTTLLDQIEKMLEGSSEIKIILSYRSEYSARIQALLDDYNFISERYTLLPLDLRGAIEAIKSVSQDEKLNEKFYLFFEDDSIPRRIAETLIGSKDAFYVAPLLQVNMDLLWKGANNRRKNRSSRVIIRWEQLEKENALMAEYDEILEYYLNILGEEYGATIERKTILKILDLFIEDEPTAATKIIEDLRNTLDEIPEAGALLPLLKKLYLLTDVEDNELATRLTHDILAKLIRPRYKKFLEVENIRLASENFDLLKNQFEEDILHLQYDKAEETLNKMLGQKIRLQDTAHSFLELVYFWNESGQVAKAVQLLQHMAGVHGNLVNIDEVIRLKDNPNQAREQIEQILESTDTKYLYDLKAKYYPKMIKVEGGTFEMGNDEGRDTEKPVHEVKLKSFTIAETPITFWQFGLYCTSLSIELEDYIIGWGFDGNNPATKICWYDAICYANWLSNRHGLNQVYEIGSIPKDSAEIHELRIDWWRNTDWLAEGYRLPSEAEWEYAARGGQLGRDKNYIFSGSNIIEEVAWYDKNSRNRTQPVKLKKPNDLGLYDMSGNVREWCWDHFDADFYQHSPYENPIGPKGGDYVALEDYVVLRGGSYIIVPFGCRVSNRDFNFPNYRYNYYGFRLVQSVQP